MFKQFEPISTASTRVTTAPAAAAAANESAHRSGLSRPPFRLASRLQMQQGLIRRLFRQQSLRWFGVLALVELALLLMAPWLASQTRFNHTGLPLAAAGLTIHSVVFSAVVWISMVALGMYQRHGREVKGVVIGTLTRLVLAMVGGALALMVLYFIAPGVQVGRGVLALSLLYAFLFLLISRLVFSRLARGGRLRRRALFLGAGQRAADLLDDGHLEDQLHSVSIVGFAASGSGQPGGPLTLDSARVIHVGASLVDTAFEQQIDDIVIASDDMRNGLSMDDLMSCRLAGINVLRLDSFYEREMGLVMLEGLRPSWFVFTPRFDGTVMRRFSRRVFDDRAGDHRTRHQAMFSNRSLKSVSPPVGTAAIAASAASLAAATPAVSVAALIAASPSALAVCSAIQFASV